MVGQHVSHSPCAPALRRDDDIPSLGDLPTERGLVRCAEQINPAEVEPGFRKMPGPQEDQPAATELLVLRAIPIPKFKKPSVDESTEGCLLVLGWPAMRHSQLSRDRTGSAAPTRWRARTAPPASPPASGTAPRTAPRRPRCPRRRR